MIGKVLGVASVALAIAVATPAVAQVQNLSFGGTLNNQSKNGATGPFGTGNASLQGKAFLVGLSYDASLFANTSNCGSVANTACTFTLTSARSITQSVTVDGVMRTFLLTSGNFTLNANGNDNFSFSITGTGIATLEGNFTAANANANGFFASQGNVTNPVFNNFSALPVRNASFTQTTTNSTTTGFYLQATSGTITSLTASNVVTGAVPEPAAWAMMIAGFGIVGGAMRRRRRVSGKTLSFG